MDIWSSFAGELAGPVAGMTMGSPSRQLMDARSLAQGVVWMDILSVLLAGLLLRTSCGYLTGDDGVRFVGNMFSFSGWQVAVGTVMWK